MMKKITELSKKEEERALGLHQKFIFINGAEPSSLHCFDEDFFKKIKESGMTAGSKMVALHELRTEKYTRYGWDHGSIFRKIGDYFRFFAEYPDKTMLVTTVQDILRAKEEGKFGIILDLQNPNPMGENIELLSVFHKLGIRIIALCYSFRNALGDGCSEKGDAGLSNLGIEAVKEMNRLGIVIDLSHAGYKSTMEAIELSHDPVLFTHANAYSIYPVARNKRDDQIKALAKKGGVIGCDGLAPTVRNVEGGPTIEDFLDHVDYIVKLVGVNHVGVGIDLPWHHTTTPELKEMLGKMYSSAYPISKSQLELRGLTAKGLDSPALFPNVTKGLVARGYSNQEIEKILGGNFLRVFKAVWKG
jgi:membrane dipeptidase